MVVQEKERKKKEKSEYGNIIIRGRKEGVKEGGSGRKKKKEAFTNFTLRLMPITRTGKPVFLIRPVIHSMVLWDNFVNILTVHRRYFIKGYNTKTTNTTIT